MLQQMFPAAAYDTFVTVRRNFLKKAVVVDLIKFIYLKMLLFTCFQVLCFFVVLFTTFVIKQKGIWCDFCICLL